MESQQQPRQFHSQRTKQPLLSLPTISRSLVSFIIGVVVHFTLTLIPCLSSTSSLLFQLALSGVVLLIVLGSGRFCRQLLGVTASAPAFVFFNLLFIWSVYFFVIRQAVPYFINAVFNGEIIMLVIGLCSILSSDPGFVTHGTSHSDKLIEVDAFEVEADNEDSLLSNRVRFCKSCKTYVKGFDHHCPAFGNCIGQGNHVLFMVLLLGFLCTEASYIMCALQFVKRSQIAAGSRLEIGLRGSLVMGTMLFTLLQVLWQVVFMAWHIYCILFNIRTEEWINWKKYPEFQVISQSQPGRSFSQMSFANPYDKGILQNVKEFFHS